MSIIEKAIDKLERANRTIPRPEEAKTEHLGAGALEKNINAHAAATSGKQTRTTRAAVLDAKKFGKSKLITSETADSALAEQFRHIKRQVLTDRPKDDLSEVENRNLIMVTSPLPQEGKTFIAANLAMSLAMEPDRNVLLIDADMVKTDLCRFFGVDKQPGLTDFLSDPERSLSDFLVKTDIPKLTFLPAGKPTRDTTELLASTRMKRLARELSQRYLDRVVIFDSMPLLSKAGSSVLAGLMGKVIVVVEAIHTPHAALRDALDMLDNSESVNLLLNKCQRRRGSRDRYGYYQNYG